MERVSVTIFTDPGCPFGFNLQRQEAQLVWHYGEALDITRRMIVLREKRLSFDELGFSRDMVEENARRLRSAYGMPMRIEAPERMAATIEACRAYVGARIGDPSRADLLLRALRRRAFSEGEALDELKTLREAASEVGIDPHALEGWLADPDVERALDEDMAAARAPLPEALALPHRLSGSDGSRRYSTGSAVFERGERRVVMPGFQPFAVYEVAMANVAPDIERRPAPRSVEELLAWASCPLATAEVAELLGVELEEARERLQAAGAKLQAAAGDGYWSAG